MKRNKYGETLLGTLIIVAIIAIIMLSIGKLVQYDSGLNFEYNKKNYLDILSKNTNSISKKINLTNYQLNENIYLYKTGNTILALSGNLNSDFKYINYLGEYINSGSYNGVILERNCLIKKDFFDKNILNCEIKEITKK
ncbi:hypothetical protein H3C61_03465 [Candidatus Gracilibacteria bacterium]|nr:hypothetical protein [Candidatus Gracilibacteria bacterium]